MATTTTSGELSVSLREATQTDTPMGFKWAPEFISESGPVLETDSKTEAERDALYDLRNWGFLYGVAYGIARGQDPYESNSSVASRAFDAAADVWEDDWEGPRRDPT